MLSREHRPPPLSPELAGDLYESVLPDGFHPFLEKLCRELDCRSATLFLGNRATGEAPGGWVRGIDPELMRGCVEHNLAAQDPILCAVQARPPGEFLTLEKVGDSGHPLSVGAGSDRLIEGR